VHDYFIAKAVKGEIVLIVAGKITAKLSGLRNTIFPDFCCKEQPHEFQNIFFIPV
jgi:hypothetical protein